MAVDVDDLDALTAFELIEEIMWQRGYREWWVPAATLNRFSRRVLTDAERDALPSPEVHAIITQLEADFREQREQ